MINDLLSVKDVCGKLNSILTKEQKKYGILVFLMIFIGGLFETLGVSIIVPLVQAMMDTEKLMANEMILPVIHFFHLNTSEKLIVFLCFCTIILYCVKNAYMCLLAFVKTRYSYKVQRELALKILNDYLRRDYTFFLNYSTSECMRDIGTDVAGVNTVLTYCFNFLAECITITMIFIFILITDYRVALVLMGIAVLCLFLVIKVFRNICKELGEKNRSYGVNVYRYSLEAFQGIKEIMVTHRQSYFLKHYEQEVIKQNHASTQFQLAQASPAYVIEAICVTGLLLYLCIFSSASQNMILIVPQLASFAIAAFRILPSLGKVSSSINNIIYAVPMVNATYEHVVKLRENKMADIGQESDCKVKTQIGEIRLEHVCWRYPNSDKEVLSDLNMVIKKGMSIAFIGTSGAGKTTLADSILGLLRPQRGKITVDGVDIYDMQDGWSKLIGYVPQAVYLTDDTIKKNIAFGIDEGKINDQKVWHALEEAQLKDFVEQLPEKLDTKVGERGIRFSGGQKQRIAIARALYGDPEILILDEATSALDNETEKAVIDAIESLQGQKTMIIVAHRLTTVRNCDEIYEVVDGKAILRDKSDILGEVL